jgi:Zn/Cd-binding protein ZinT
MRFLIDKTDGHLNLRTLTEFFRTASNGCYMINITKQRRGRTLNQNDWLWGCVYPILLDGLLDAGWEFTSVEQVHEFFKKQMAQDKVVNYHTGEVMEIPKSTATMDTQQFSMYIDALRSYAEDFLNVTIPDPDKNWRTAR